MGNRNAWSLIRKANAWRHRLPWGHESGLQKYDIINVLAKKNGHQSYLEICTTSTGGRFWKIDRKQLRVCHRLVYRCPEQFGDGDEITYRSADESIENLLPSHPWYDVVFVDPWHNFECSMRDLQAGLSVLQEDGVMIVHDCCPPNREYASPKPAEGSWCGVTYSAYIELLLSRRDLTYYTVDTDYGCGVIRKKLRAGAPKPGRRMTDELAERWRNQQSQNADMFELFCNHKRELLNLVSVEDFLSIENVQAPLSVRSASFFAGRASQGERPSIQTGYSQRDEITSGP
jgi:hypothetical protein